MEIWGNFVSLLTSALIALYGMAGSYGIAIIVFTIIVRLLFLPLSIKSTKSMRAMQENQAKLKPELDALKKKHGNDRQKLMEEQTKLYKEHGMNPLAGLGGCLPLLIQMPIWIALYQALFSLAGTSDFQAPFLWIPNLAETEGFPYLLAAFTGGSQWVIQRMMVVQTADPQQKTMNQMMQIMMPAMMVFFAFQLPAGLVLYWATSNVFQFFQQLFTTGWGALAPSQGSAGQPSGAAARNAPKASAKSDEGERVEPASERVSSNGKEDRKAVAGPHLLDDAPSTMKNGFRVYTLEPDGDNGADYSAERGSQSMEESIARAKGQGKSGQAKPKRKKRKGK